MAEVVVLVTALFLIVALAVAVVVAGTAESRKAAQSLPGGRWVSRQVERVADQVNPKNAHSGFGLLSSPERDRRAERWFENAEGKVVGVLSRSSRSSKAAAADDEEEELRRTSG